MLNRLSRREGEQILEHWGFQKMLALSKKKKFWKMQRVFFIYRGDFQVS